MAEPRLHHVSREPRWIAMDALLVAALAYLTVIAVRGPTYVQEFGTPTTIGWILLLIPAVLVIVRRFAPIGVLLVSAAACLLAGLDHGDDGNWILPAPFVAYTVVRVHGSRIGGLVIAPTAAAVSLVTFYGPGKPNPMVLVIVLSLYAAGWVVGDRMSQSHRRTSSLVEEARIARELAEATALQAVKDERARIALELHDAVGHAVNVMVMQAGAARVVAPDGAAAATLREIERVGRTALTDLDRMLGLLNDRADSGVQAPTAPARGMADIEGLVAGVRAGGVDVELDNRCAEALDPLVDRPVGAAAYRIVQEALTNAVKHAGPARIAVVLTCCPEALHVSITDDGRGSAAGPTVGDGRGIAGMRERVAVLGGSINAAPRVGGGFAVEVRLPRPRQP